MTWGVCSVHFLREALGHARREQQPMLAALLRPIFNASDTVQAKELLGAALDRLEKPLPKVAIGDRLMLRLGTKLAAQALERTHVHPRDFTGRPMTGMVYVAPEGLRGKALRSWVEQAAGFA